ncbi:putative ribonuclease H-like domain-containing protein, partial [Tanacetum coccineum]
MEFESAHSNTTAKLPILKLGEYEMWVIRIKQYFQVQYYALWEVIENGNEATKKTQKTLLKQQYENFSASSTESLDSIFNRLQKIVSRLAILGVVITQEDLNSKFLRSLPPEWNTHVVVWMNKAEIEIMSIDDLYNNFKIIEQSVKKFIGASSGAQNLAFMTALSTSSTNDVNTAKPAYEVSTVSPNVNTASPQVSTASFSDNVVYAFMVENPNGSNLLQQDLEKIHEDDLEVIDLKWQLSLLSMRANRYFQRTGKKIFINANDIVGYDKSNVECFNCHKMGHFAMECRAPRNKEEEQVQTNMALMAFSNSKVYNDKTFSKTCLKNYETLKKQCDDLIVKLNQTEFTAATYKRGLATIEEELITYRKNAFEKVKQEKEGIEFKIKKFDKASKDLDKLLGSQITDKSKKGSGYIAVPSPHPLIYNRPKKLDQSYSGLDEFKGYRPENSKQESNIVCDKKSDESKENSNNSLVKEQVSKDTSSFVESSLNVDKENVFPIDKKGSVQKPSKGKDVNTAKAQAVNTARPQAVNTARPNTVKTARPYSTVVNAVRVNQANAVKASACWVWRPTKPNGASITLKKHNYIDGKPQQDDTGFVNSGCSRHMTGNIVNLSDFKEFDRGYVTFGGGARGGRIYVVAGTIINESAGTQEELNAGTLEEISQDCIVMPIWKDASYFDSLSKDVDNSKPKSAANDQKQVEDGLDNENAEKDKSDDDSSPKEVNAAGQHVNTASPDVNIDSPKDMFTMGASHTPEAIHVEFFSDEDEPEVDLGNITNSYIVPTTPNTRIHKDHPIKNVIGDVKSSVQTRRMTKPTSEQGFLSAVYEQKTHDTLNTCLYACFLSQIEPG